MSCTSSLPPGFEYSGLSSFGGLAVTSFVGTPRHRASCGPPVKPVPLADVLGTALEVHPCGRSDRETSALFACAFSLAVGAAPAEADTAPAVRPPTANPIPNRLAARTRPFF